MRTTMTWSGRPAHAAQPTQRSQAKGAGAPGVGVGGHSVGSTCIVRYLHHQYTLCSALVWTGQTVCVCVAPVITTATHVVAP